MHFQLRPHDSTRSAVAVWSSNKNGAKQEHSLLGGREYAGKNPYTITLYMKHPPYSLLAPGKTRTLSPQQSQLC